MPGLVLTELELIGKARNHVVQAVDHGCACFAATPDVVEAFARLQRVARQGGFGLAPYSAFRNFKTQKRICNHKCNGRKPLFDEAGTRTGASITSSKQRKRARRARCRGYGARRAAIRDQKVLEFKLDYNDALFDRSNIPRTGSYGAMVSNIGQASQTARC